MSQIAILSDIHANLSALEAVLARVDSLGISQICFLGDIVDYGPGSELCIRKVRESGGCCVLGNMEVDHFGLGPEARSGRRSIDATSRSPASLSEMAADESLDDFEFMMGLPYSIEAYGAWLAHACLNRPESFHYLREARDAVPTLDYLSESVSNVGFFGHTHVRNMFTKGEAEVIRLSGNRFHIPKNTACAITVGSVGQPRCRHDPRGSWVTWDASERIVQFHKTII